MTFRQIAAAGPAIGHYCGDPAGVGPEVVLPPDGGSGGRCGLCADRSACLAAPLAQDLGIGYYAVGAEAFVATPGELSQTGAGSRWRLCRKRRRASPRPSRRGVRPGEQVLVAAGLSAPGADRVFAEAWGGEPMGFVGRVEGGLGDLAHSTGGGAGCAHGGGAGVAVRRGLPGVPRRKRRASVCVV